VSETAIPRKANISVAPGRYFFRSLIFPALEFATFAFDQELQLIQQLRVMGADRLHQI